MGNATLVVAIHSRLPILGLPYGSAVKNLSAMWETWVQSLGWEDPLEKGKDIHFSIVAPREFYREYIENYIENR